MRSKLFKTGLIVFLTVTLSGCVFVFQKGRRSDTQRIEELSQQVDDLNRAKKMLEDRLGSEIQDKQVTLKLMEKGLVITVVGDLVFDSGKAKIRPQAYSVLNKVAVFLNESMPQFNVGIEGHTDNVPIKHSGWKSNWELSSARALSVLHYLVKKEGVSPSRLSAIGYGEYRPVTTNDTKEGRLANRRVEIVILPNVTKVTNKTAEPAAGLTEPQENLK